MPDTHIQLHIDLSGLAGRMQRILKAATNLVAIGLNSLERITSDAMTIPGVTIQHEFDSNNPWSVDEAREAWKLWVLRNGFRDAAETVSGTLEEVQAVLSYWQLAQLQKESGGLLGEDWNKIVVSKGQQFHRRTLPQKIEFLQKEYDYTPDSTLLRQVITINIGRNCLVHRGGIVTPRDANVPGYLEIEWSALLLTAVKDGIEQELVPPQEVEAGTSVAIGTRARSKKIAVGQLFEVSAVEFAQICWTFFIFAQTCAQRLEAYGKERGMDIKPNAT